ncbi:hypothetical protein CTAYLR_009026 [Chrysophaeum taylorii]|uniref:Uncharacterized protein n=1 Tax=Chrysophaeum taylorii TaxID=2483200 RepID=A0AAD7UDR1_9STRA|nr:hypothetical protein CTAYLR_009026 [Chrysophaeum taylorii]
MCERSWSEGGGDLDKLPPHIRDALDRAAKVEDKTSPEKEGTTPMDLIGETRQEPSTSSTHEASSLKAEVEKLRERCSLLERREASLTALVKEKTREAEDLRCYVHDALRLHEREHAYLRATHLDPAIGLEIELLKEQLARYQAADDPAKRPDDLVSENAELERKNNALVAQNDELAAAAAAAECERNHLRLRLQELREELNVAREWNDQLEEEREELYGMLHQPVDPSSAKPT